jgi:hypothetical protein
MFPTLNMGSTHRLDELAALLAPNASFWINLNM